MCAIPVAAAGAHGDGHPGAFWHHGFWQRDAVVAGTVVTVGTGSFSASAYVVMPGPGNSGTAPVATPATILIGPSTKVITPGQSGIVQSDHFYAVYAGAPAGTPLSALEGDTPSVIYAWPVPAPEVEVRGQVTTAPASGSDSFVATAHVVAQVHFYPVGICGAGPVHWAGGSVQPVAGGSAGGGSAAGGSAGGGSASAQARGARVRAAQLRSAQCLPGPGPVSAETPNTTITTDAATQVTIDGQASSVGNLADGDWFTAVYDGTPDESLATITSTPALSVSAWAPLHGSSLYAFAGTVTGVDASAGTISVNVTRSIPNSLLSGADTFDVGSQTIVLGNPGNTLFGSLGNVTTGDVVAGGMIAPGGESAATVESAPLQVLVDFSQAASSSPATASKASVRRAERRALKLLRSERAHVPPLGGH